MSHQKIIQDLIAWIDEHIDQPLNIDVVAKKIRLFKVVLATNVPHGDASDAWRLHSPTSPVTGRR
ncbi:AraC family transcriptional regulator [Escherichia coli]|nr:AraC family transcriptional regulator [Escherichia coli]